MRGKALIQCPVHRPIQDWAYGKPMKLILQWPWDWYGVLVAMLSHIVKDRWLGLGVPIPSPITTWTPQQEWREKELSSGCCCIPQASIVNASVAFRAFLPGSCCCAMHCYEGFGNTPISKKKEKFVVKERIPSPYFGFSLLNRTRRTAFYSYV